MRTIIVLTFFLLSDMSMAQTKISGMDWYLFTLKSDSFKYNCYKRYIQLRKYDSLIAYTQTMYKDGRCKLTDVYKNLAVAYWNSGRRDSSLYFIDKAVELDNQSRRTVSDETDIFFLDDYIFYYPICFNDSLINVYLNEQITYYRSHHYPWTGIGKKILLLGFKDQKIRIRSEYYDAIGDAKDSLFVEEDRKNWLLFTGIIKEYGYLDDEKIGRLSVVQNLLFWHVPDSASRVNVLIPALQSAYASHKIDGRILISNIVRTEDMLGHLRLFSDRYKLMVDSLCEKYSYKKDDFIYSFN